MAVAFCLECGNSISLDDRLREGQRLICTECGARIEVISLRPLELDWAYDEPYRNPWEDWENDLDLPLPTTIQVRRNNGNQ